MSGDKIGQVAVFPVTMIPVLPSPAGNAIFGSTSGHEEIYVLKSVVMDKMNNVKKYTVISSNENGDSVFEDALIELSSRSVALGVPPMLVNAMSSATGVSYLRSGEFDSEPHPAPREQWVVMLRGTLEIEVTDGSKRQFSPGDLVMVTDIDGKGHVTTSVGEPPFEALFIAVS